jgi:hypothetical protein
MEPRGVTLKKAGELIGGDEPLSKRAISAMIARGDLEAYGRYRGRRVTLRSIRAYQEGRSWQSDASADHGAVGMPSLLKIKRGSRSFQKSKEGTTSGAGSIPARLPKRGLIRS